MTNDLRQVTERLVSLSNEICEESAGSGMPEDDVVLVKKKFATWKFPLPSDLLDIWRICAGTPWHGRDRSLLKSPLGPNSIDEPDTDILDPSDIERYGYLNLGNGCFVSLTMNRDGQVSLDTKDYDIHPASYPYMFKEGFAKYVEAVAAEVANGDFDPEEE